MKKAYILLLCLPLSFVFAQSNITKRGSIAEAEMKSAAQTMNIEVNPNTANYDITYHKLEFTVNPNTKFISGKVTTTFTALSNMNTITVAPAQNV